MIYYYIIINLISFVLYGIDKRKAISHQYRISEKTLFLLSLLGGVFASLLGMFLFHHKIRKPMFYFVHFISLLIHFYIIYTFVLSL